MLPPLEEGWFALKRLLPVGYFMPPRREFLVEDEVRRYALLMSIEGVDECAGLGEVFDVVVKELESLVGGGRSMRSRQVTRFLLPAAGRLAEERAVATGKRLRTEGLMGSSRRLGRGGSVDRYGEKSGNDVSRGSSSSMISYSSLSSSSSKRVSEGGATGVKRKMDVPLDALDGFLERWGKR